MKELIRKAKDIRTQMAHATISGHVYKKWGADFRATYVDDAVKELNEDGYNITINDIKECSESELREAGFSAWEEPDSDNKVLMLVPLTLVPFIDKELVVECFSSSDEGGSKVYKLGEVDLDHRYGSIAYGIKVDATPVDDKPTE